MTLRFSTNGFDIKGSLSPFLKDITKTLPTSFKPTQAIHCCMNFVYSIYVPKNIDDKKNLCYTLQNERNNAFFI